MPLRGAGSMLVKPESGSCQDFGGEITIMVIGAATTGSYFEFP